MIKRKAHKRVPDQHHSFPRLKSVYQEALAAYWARDHEQVKSLISQNLEPQSADETTFCLYRLWIESLCALNEYGSLRLLARHLADWAEIHKSYQELFYSLVTMIHLELDEIDAARLRLRSLVESRTNLYMEEVRIKLAMRTRSQPPSAAINALAQYTYDYLQCEWLAGCFLELSDYKSLKGLRKRVEEIYPESPFASRTELFRSLHQEQWTKASRLAKSLYQSYPNDYETTFCYASLDLIQERPQRVAKTIKRSPVMQSDAKFRAVLGASCAQLYRRNHDLKAYQEAEEHLRQAIRMGQENGSDVSYPANQLMSLKGMKKNQDNQREPRVWMVKVSAKAFHKLRTEQRSSEYARKALGNQVRKGDACLVVYEDKVRSKVEPSWRLGALFSVVEDPQWHPVYRYQSVLKLEHMPAIAIPLDINQEDAPADMDQYSWEDGRRHGVFELDSQALAIIEQNLEEFAEEYEAITETFDQLKVAR
jgi:hypothetical protein